MKTAIIGMGPHGKRLIQLVKRMPDLKLAGIVDRNDEALSAISEIDPSLKFLDTASLYENVPDLEVLLIATNGPSHATLALEAMDKNIPYLLVEKPMACSAADCRQMEQEARKKKIRLAVNKKNRHDGVFQYIKENLDAGNWGSIRNIYIQIPGIGLGCVATHWLDMANFLIGQFPKKVSAWVDPSIGPNPRGSEFIDPGGLVICDYGPQVKAIISQIEDGAGPITIEIHTTAARIYYDPKNSIIDIRLRDLSIKPGPGRPAVYHQVELPTHLNLKGNMLDQMEGVLKELISEKPMLTDARYGTMAIEILVAAHLSHQQGNIPIELPLRSEEQLNLYLPIT